MEAKMKMDIEAINQARLELVGRLESTVLKEDTLAYLTKRTEELTTKQVFELTRLVLLLKSQQTNVLQ
jgi:hypothetical protein